MPINGNYVHSREITEYLLKKSPKTVKFFQNLGVNNGENLNNIVTAVGTAGVAPIFIRYNPIAKFYEKDQDPEKAIRTRSYSAWRQPLSAVLTLAVLTPVNNLWTGFCDKLAATKRIDRIDLSGKPPYSVLIDKAKADYKYEKAFAKMKILDEEKRLGRKLKTEELQGIWPYEKKSEFIRRRIASYQDQAFYNEVTRLRNDSNVILETEFNKLSKAEKESGKYKVIKDIDLVSPENYKASEKEAVKKLLKQKGVTEEEMKKFEISDSASIKGRKIKKFLKSKGIDNVKEFKKTVTAETEKIGIDNVTKIIRNETATKLRTSRILNNMHNELEEEIRKIDLKKMTSEQAKVKIKEAKTKIFNDTIDRLKAIANKAADTKKEPIQRLIEVLDLSDDAVSLDSVIKKLSSYDSMESIKFHGATTEEVMRSVKIKYWEKTLINRADNVLKNFKKMTGVAIALAVLPLSCGLLNWAYPRFMEKFLPDLANVKTVSKDAVVIEPKKDDKAVKEAEKKKAPEAVSKEVK